MLNYINFLENIGVLKINKDWMNLIVESYELDGRYVIYLLPFLIIESLPCRNWIKGDVICVTII